MKTSDLTGPALDWAVAKACFDDTLAIYFDENTGEPLHRDDFEEPQFQPSTYWSQGGPIIEREGIGLDFYEDGGHEYGGEWGAATNEGTVHALGRTPLIAAMRCFVASRLGDEVEIPEDLK